MAAMMNERMGVKPRIILLLELSQKTHESWLKISKSCGMTQVAVASRLIEWYSKQPHTMALIIGNIPSAIRESH
jgi:hypothetical protein